MLSEKISIIQDLGKSNTGAVLQMPRTDIMDYLNQLFANILTVLKVDKVPLYFKEVQKPKTISHLNSGLT